MGDTAEVLAPEASHLLTREEAAVYCSLSLDTFDRLKDSIRRVQFTKRTVRYDPKDLDAWLEHLKVGGSIGREASRTSASGTRRSATTSARANAILAKLTKKRSASTPPSSPERGGR